MTLEDRLVRCFSAVFPALAREEILSASRDSLSAWDSLAGITLMTVLQEEFEMQIDLARLDHLNSFPAALEYLRRAVPGQS